MEKKDYKFPLAEEILLDSIINDYEDTYAYDLKDIRSLVTEALAVAIKHKRNSKIGTDQHAYNHRAFALLISIETALGDVDNCFRELGEIVTNAQEINETTETSETNENINNQNDEENQANS